LKKEKVAINRKEKENLGKCPQCHVMLTISDIKKGTKEKTPSIAAPVSIFVLTCPHCQHILSISLNRIL